MEELEIKLRNLMINKCGSVSAFAASIGIPYTTVDSILKRGVQKANIDNIIKICAALEISVDELARGVIKKKIEEPTTIAAHFDGDEYTEEELEKIKQFAEFVKSQRPKSITPVKPIKDDTGENEGEFES